LALVVILNCVVVPELTTLESCVRHLKMPDVVGFLDDLTSSLWIYVCHVAFPASFADVKQVFHPSVFDDTSKAVLSAPTGSGKSTDMIYSIFLDYIEASPFPEKRLYVIVPRVALAKGLSQYVNGRFAWVTGYITGEGKENEDARVIYITTGSFLVGHGKFFSHGHLFVLDEFHLDEVETCLCRGLLHSSDERVIYASATPVPMSDTVNVDIITSNSYTYETEDLWIHRGVPIVQGYQNLVLQIGRSTNPWMKHLVFVDSFAELDNLAEVLPGSVGEISSRRYDVDDKAWILATSSADVGVTVPNVDVVITKTLSYRPGPSGPALYELSSSLIKQRSGRTGRTNNGFVYLVHPPEGQTILKSFAGVPVVELICASHRLGLGIDPSLWQNMGIDSSKEWFETMKDDLMKLGGFDVQLIAFIKVHFDIRVMVEKSRDFTVPRLYKRLYDQWLLEHQTKLFGETPPELVKIFPKSLHGKSDHFYKFRWREVCEPGYAKALYSGLHVLPSGKKGDLFDLFESQLSVVYF